MNQSIKNKLFNEKYYKWKYYKIYRHEKEYFGSVSSSKYNIINLSDLP